MLLCGGLLSPISASMGIDIFVSTCASFPPNTFKTTLLCLMYSLGYSGMCLVFLFNVSLHTIFVVFNSNKFIEKEKIFLLASEEIFRRDGTRTTCNKGKRGTYCRYNGANLVVVASAITGPTEQRVYSRAATLVRSRALVIRSRFTSDYVIPYIRWFIYNKYIYGSFLKDNNQCREQHQKDDRYEP